MYFLEQNQISEAFHRLILVRKNKVDNGILGILFLLKNSKTNNEISGNTKIEFSEKQTTKDLNHIFSFQKREVENTGPDSSYILAENFEEEIYDLLQGEKLNLTDLAIVCLQTEPFVEKLSIPELQQHFVKSFKLPARLIAKCFSLESSIQNINYTTTQPIDENRKTNLETTFQNPDGLDTIEFKGRTSGGKSFFWQSALGGDFGRGAYTQKMKGSSGLKSILFIPVGKLQNNLMIGSTPTHVEINKNELNILFYGPAGTGKSTEARRKLKEEKCVNQTNICQITFHPEYTYSEFVGSLKPITIYKELSSQKIYQSPDKSLIKYVDVEPLIEFKFEPGPFIDACIKAANDDPKTPHALIIDEINRGNVPEILGDIFQLLDRDQLTYSNSNSELNRYLNEHCINDNFANGLVIPNNLYIYATINPTDQNVFPLDTAFKRRWDRNYIGVDPSHKSCVNWSLNICNTIITWSLFLTVINEHMTKNLNLSEDKQIGHFFIKLEDNYSQIEQENETLKVISYLWEDIPKSKRYQLFSHNLITFSDVFNTLKQSNSVEKIFTDTISTKLAPPQASNSNNPN